MALSSAKLHLNNLIQDCFICMLLVSDGHLCSVWMAYLLAEEENGSVCCCCSSAVEHWVVRKPSEKRREALHRMTCQTKNFVPHSYDRQSDLNLVGFRF